jgi:hypothetical protein
VLPADPAAAAPIYEKNFADIAAHGINVISVPNSPPAHHKLVLDTARKHGLKVILELDLDGGELGHMIRGHVPLDENCAAGPGAEARPIKDHPALWRVQLIDEPTDFQKFGKIAALTRKFAPNSRPFCCLIGQVDGAEFLRQSKSDVICFDVYPYGPNNKPGDMGPLNFFRPVRAALRRLGRSQRPTRRRVGGHPVPRDHGGLRFPTINEVRAMSYVSLAAGQRGLFWFLYQTQRVGPQTTMSGLVDRDFNARPLWDELPKLIDELKPLTATLSRLRPDRTARYEIENGLCYALRDRTARTLYLFVVNPDTLRPRVVHVTTPLRNGVITPIPEEQPLDVRGVAGTHRVGRPAGTGLRKLFRVQ